jgi:hypothetical protein
MAAKKIPNPRYDTLCIRVSKAEKARCIEAAAVAGTPLADLIRAALDRFCDKWLPNQKD